MMLATKNGKILDLIERLTVAIREARAAQLDNTAWLLQVAILDLQAIAFSISDDELRHFTDAVADGLEAAKTPRH